MNANFTIYLERDFRLTGLFEPSFGERLRDLDDFLLGDRDFLALPECADALLPLRDLAFSLPLRDFTKSLDFERLRDSLTASFGDGERESVPGSPEASISKKISKHLKI